MSILLLRGEQMYKVKVKDEFGDTREVSHDWDGTPFHSSVGAERWIAEAQEVAPGCAYDWEPICQK